MYVVMLVALVMGSVAFSSCGDDEEEDVQTSSIVGTWKAQHHETSIVIIFKSNGTGTLAEYNAQGQNVGIVEEFKYRYDSEGHHLILTFIMNGEEVDEEMIPVEIIDNNTMILWDFTFKRQK